ncbi:hypothetical protein THMIRHAS_00830 [Thiosulfatimonas sediminis]|uniref:Uncharacterized protein n=1 Tax=Thiosulfatimonas sediminis TaxID=2675054 RepID=A0A6F8PRU5_9GAMM|nr:hypothetical protein [Thiosulfatimonas sediminis]BBP44710.1 hypothetical protein THMIRHAS_00830 [Thiosulfatimonas sediminis]
MQHSFFTVSKFSFVSLVLSCAFAYSILSVHEIQDIGNYMISVVLSILVGVLVEIIFAPLNTPIEALTSFKYLFATLTSILMFDWLITKGVEANDEKTFFLFAAYLILGSIFTFICRKIRAIRVER